LHRRRRAVAAVVDHGRVSEPGYRSAWTFSRGERLAKFVLDAGQIANMAQAVGHHDVAAQFVTVALAYENAAFAPDATRSRVLE